jgi:hypothetical protein
MPDRPAEKQTRSEGLRVLLFILCFVALLIAIASWYFTYNFPGSPATVGGFVLLFAREILVLLVLVVGAAVFLWRKLRTFLAASRSGEQ